MIELHDPTLGQALFLATAALVAGLIDAIAGGGGLITLPALLAVGLPPHLALGTNKGQSVFGSSASLVRFSAAGLVDRGRAPRSFVLGLLGSFAGAALVLAIRPEVLRPLVLVLLIGVALFLTLRRGGEPRRHLVTPARAPLVGALIALVIGAYDGFFGPGTGTFLILAFAAFLGDQLNHASANAKVVNFASNLAAMSLFAWRGQILWAFAVPMAAAQLVGGWVGAHLAVRIGDGLVRRAVLFVVLALIVKTAHDLAVG